MCCSVFTSPFSTASTGSDSSPAVNTGSWQLLTGTEQGASPWDPGGFALSGTTFDSATGRFVFVVSSSATTIDGYRENQIRWTQPVVQLYPDFDHLTDTLDLIFTGSIETSPAQLGISIGILDRETASLASAIGPHVGLCPLNSASIRTVGLSTTGFSATNNLSNQTVLWMQNWFMQQTSPLCRASCQSRSPSPTGTWSEGGLSVVTTAMTSSISSWRISIGHLHGSNTTGTMTMDGYVYHRRTRHTPGKPAGF